MVQNTRIYWLHALTPLHVGAGMGVGFIDLPILREKVTNWPVVPGSGVKGVLADKHKATKEARKGDVKLKAAFGIADDQDTLAGANSGSLVFTDARLACLAVRSLYGTFAWVASPMALSRLRRDLDVAGLASGLPEKLDDAAENAAFLPQGVVSALSTGTGADRKVYLEDLDLNAQQSAAAASWCERLAAWIFPGDRSWQEEFGKRFALLHGNTFDYLSERGMEVSARVRIDDERKTVARGQLWYEEYLPAESVLGGLIWCDKVFPKDAATPEDLLRTYCSGEALLQMGGKATVGRGRVRCIFGGDHAK